MQRYKTQLSQYTDFEQPLIVSEAQADYGLSNELSEDELSAFRCVYLDLAHE